MVGVFRRITRVVLLLCTTAGVSVAKGDEPTVIIRGDGGYENAIAWQYEGASEPDFGAFAVRYPEALTSTISGVVLDLTSDAPAAAGFPIRAVSPVRESGRSGHQLSRQSASPLSGTSSSTSGSPSGSTSGSPASVAGAPTLDVYIWDESDGIPGAVTAVQNGVSVPLDVSWPNFARFVFPVEPPLGCEATVGEAVWVGFWGDWPGEAAAAFVGVDQDGFGPAGMTRITPDLGFPTGWQDVSTAWGGVTALGIGILAEPCGVEPVLLSTWGTIKMLYAR